MTLKRTITEQHDRVLLRDYLRDALHLSSRLLKKVKMDGKIRVNGSDVTVRYVLRTGDQLELIFPQEEKNETIILEHRPLDIVYEDDDVLIINKEPMMPSIPSHLHRVGTVANRLLAYYQSKGVPYTVHIVTRLDKDTSGLMLIAKHQYSHSLLARQQKEKQLCRTYEAIVHGVIRENAGMIDLPIGREKDSIVKRTITENGQEAITHYERLKQFLEYAHVKVRLETGRTHQIRVHFSAIGHPLVGDDLYGGSKSILQRQALHCSRIQFIHPISNQLIDISSPLPKDMKSFLQNLS